MKEIFEIKDKDIIYSLLDDAEYGTLAICKENIPYSLPVNFIRIDNLIYFHGSKKGRKIETIKANPKASFSVTKELSLIQSYFSSNDNLACPATQFFKSVIIDGQIEFVEKYDEKVLALQKLMEKLQPEGGYRALNDEVYKKIINATTIYKLIPNQIKAKFKLGQNLNKERFEMIVENLEKRGDELDKDTLSLMKYFRNNSI